MGDCHRSEQKLARHENGKPAPKHGQYLDHNNALGTWTHALLTARHSARTGSLGGTGGNSSHRRRMLRALENRTQTADYPSRITTRSHANSLELALLNTASENQTVSRGVTNEVNFCKRLKTHLSKSNRSSKQYEIRHPTHTGHSGSVARGNLPELSSAYTARPRERETMHKTRLPALRRKLVSEQATRR